jgi:hypothetical protein
MPEKKSSGGGSRGKAPVLPKKGGDGSQIPRRKSGKVPVLPPKKPTKLGGSGGQKSWDR